MSADPTPPPAAARPGALIEFVRTERANAAYVVLGLAAAFLAGAVYLATQANKAGGTTPDAPLVDPRNPDAPPPPTPEIDNPKKGDYWVGCIAAGVACLVCASAGSTLLVRVQPPSVAEQRSWTRGFILIAGGLLGLVGFGLTLVLLIRWNESVVAAVQAYDTGGTATARSGARWLVQLLIGMVVSIGVVFLVIQPARAEERHNQTLRRLVYGGNLVLTALLLFDALLILNVVFAMKVPNTLDTTESGFYTLSKATEVTVGNLAEPVTAYVILPDDNGRETNDVRQLMHSAQHVSNGKFTPRFVSPVTDKTELQRLQEKFSKLDKTAAGVLLAVGEDGRRHEFIPFQDLIKIEPGPGGGQKFTFVGEAALVQKLRFLGDVDARPVVYFTQGSGEMSLGGGGPGDFAKAEREVSRLKTHLETYSVDVRPLEFMEGGKAEVPADAAIVVVADPMSSLPDPAVKALKDYMNRPAEPAKKGKLVVLAEARPGVKDRKMLKTGLEGLLAEFNVRLGDQFIYSYPDARNGAGPRDATVVFAGGRENSHPIVAPFDRRVGIPWSVPREVAPVAAGGPGPFTATTLMETMRGRPTWVEPEQIDSPIQALNDLLGSPPLRTAKQFSQAPRSVAVAVSEGGAPPNPMNPHGGGGGEKTGRLVAFANSEWFSNAIPAPRGGPPATYELFTASIDWLRGRPPIAPGTEKPYETYQLPPGETLNTTRLYLLPIGLALLAVAGLGAGVWVIRRK